MAQNSNVDYRSLINIHIAPVQTPLDAVYEVFTNALEAIKLKEIKNPQTEKQINVSLFFTALFSEEDEKNGKPLHYLTDISIEDSGIGFDSENYNRFKKVFDSSKGFFNKGSGRYRLLKMFDHIYYRSIYEENGKYWERKFIFSERYADEGFIGEHSLTEVSKQPTGTKVLLKHIRRKANQHLPIDNTSLKDIKSIIVKKYMPEFCLNRSEVPNIYLKEYLNDTNKENILITVGDFPKVDKSGKIEIPFYKIQNKKIQKTAESAHFEINIFKIDSHQLPTNEVFCVSKGMIIEDCKIPFPLLDKTDKINDKRFLILTSGEYFNNPASSNDARNFSFLSREKWEELARSHQTDNLFDMQEEKFLLRDSFEESYEREIVKFYPEVTQQIQDKELNLEKLQKMFLISNEVMSKLKSKFNKSEKEILEDIYKQDARCMAALDAKTKRSMDALEKLDSTDEHFEEKLNQLTDEITATIPLANRSAICRYIARRNLTLQYFCNLLDSKIPLKIREKHFHQVLLKQGEKNSEKSNLWVINEEFIYFSGFSDIPFSEITIGGKKVFKEEFSQEEARYLESLGENRLKKRPDVLLFPEENKCIILEFKNKDVNLSDHLHQINKYAYLLRNYTCEEFDFNCFFGYLIGEGLEEEDIRAVDAAFKPVHNLKYMVRPHEDIVGKNNKPDGFLYTEIINYSTLLERAIFRNKIFIKKIGMKTPSLSCTSPTNSEELQ